MNKKELARLLFQRKDIRALFESRRFDASTLKRVISEEIMRESEESGFTDLEIVQARENADEMKELQVSLNLAQDNLKAFQSDYLKAKERFTQAKVDGDKAAQSSERGEMAQAKTFKREERERIDKIVAQIAYLKSLGVTASKTQTPDDDEYVGMAVNTVAQNIKNATDMINTAENEAQLAGISRDVATSNSGELETAQKAVQAAVAKDKEQPTVDYNKTIEAIKKVKTPQATTPDQVSTELISKKSGIGFDAPRATSLIMNPIVAAVRRLSFLAGLTFGIENLTIEDVMYYVSGNESYGSRASQALKQLEKTVGEKQWKDRVKGFTSMNKQKLSAVISKMEGKELEIVKTIIQRELDAAKSELSAGGVSMKPFAEQEAGSSAPSTQEPGTPEAPEEETQGSTAFEELMRSSRRSDFQNIYQKFLSRNLESINADFESKQKLTQSLKAFQDLDPIYTSSSYEADKAAADKSLKSISFSILGIKAPEQRNQLLQKFRGFIAKGSDKVIPSPEETPPQPPAAPGWKNAKSAARAKVTEDTTIEEIKTSLESADAFKAFWGVKGEVDTKMEQAKALFDDEYFAARIEELRAKATDEDKKQEVAEEAANLAATVMGYSEFLNNMMAKQPEFQPPLVDLPQAIPANEEEFKKQFIEPIAPEGAKVGTSPQDYIALGKQVIQQAGDLLKDFENNQVVERFLGWYVGGLSTNTLEESVADVGVELVYAQKISEYDKVGDITKVIKGEPQKWNNIFTKLDELVKTGQIKINKSDEPVEEEDTKLLTQQVLENTPEVEPDADADLSPLATEEMDAAWTTTLDVFFGKSREKSSFMRQFLLKNQASMLYGMIGVLEQIITGGAGGEERSLSNEKTQVKQREQPAPPPAEAEKEKETSKTDTTSTDTPVDDEETEKTTSVIPESLEEQVINEIFGMFGGKDNEDKEIKFSPKSTSLMRQDLEAMVDLLRSLKTDIGQYKKYSTSSSVDPRFDGSTLKRAMDAKLKVVQQSIAHLTKVIDIEVQSQKDQLKADGAQAGQDSVDLQEASGSDRKVRIAEVEKVYNEMRRQYLKGLKVSLSTNDAEKAKAGAKELKDYVMGQETFMSYFPSNIITSSGGVMTLGAAHESMVAIIAPFIETIRDIVTITKTQKVSESNLQQAIGNLVMISDSIESMFKVPSLIDREFMKKYIEAAKQNPENQPLTDEEPGMMDKARELTGKALDKLKQMFSWMSNETRKLLLKFFGEDSELIDGLSNSDLSEEQQEALVEDIVESKTWYQNLEQDAKSAVDALVKYLINEVGRDSLKQLNYPAVVSEKLNDDERRTISNFAQETQETFGKELSNRTYKFLHAADEDIKVSSMKLMVEETDDLVSYLTTIFKIVDKISKEAAEEMVSPQTATITQGDQDPNVEDGTPNPPGDLDKDNSELEDVDKPEDEEEKDDATDITALKAPITNQWAQFGDAWLKLSDKARTIIPDLAGELALKFIEEGAESLSPKPSPEVEQDLEEVLGFSMKEKVAKTISEVEKELRSTKNERFSENSPWAFYSGPSSEAGDGVAAGVRGKRSKSIAINTSMSILNANKDKIEKMLKVSKKKDIIELLKQMVLTKGVPALLGNAGIDFQNNLLSNPFMKQYKASKEFQDFSNSLETGHTEENRQPVDLEEALRPIIEKMLNEHYNH